MESDYLTVVSIVAPIFMQTRAKRFSNFLTCISVAVAMGCGAHVLANVRPGDVNRA